LSIEGKLAPGESLVANRAVVCSRGWRFPTCPACWWRPTAPDLDPYARPSGTSTADGNGGCTRPDEVLPLRSASLRRLPRRLGTRAALLVLGRAAARWTRPGLPPASLPGWRRPDLPRWSGGRSSENLSIEEVFTFLWPAWPGRIPRPSRSWPAAPAFLHDRVRLVFGLQDSATRTSDGLLDDARMSPQPAVLQLDRTPFTVSRSRIAPGYRGLPLGLLPVFRCHGVHHVVLDLVGAPGAERRRLPGPRAGRPPALTAAASDRSSMCRRWAADSRASS